MARQRVSDILKRQDLQTARGAAFILMALQARHPDDVNLKFGLKAVEEFASGLQNEITASTLVAAVAPKPTPEPEVYDAAELTQEQLR